jgi:glycosyltransferase involved in cell wall biosynthesis
MISFMRVLLSAYSCAPGHGSEPEVGLRTVLEVARNHETWVLTRSDYVAGLEAAAQAAGVYANVRVVGVPAPWLREGSERPETPLPSLPVQHFQYEAWQRRAADEAEILHEAVGFDVAHHVTLSAYWARTATAALTCPVVLGPMGGGLTCPARLTPVLGLRGATAETARVVVQTLNAARPSVRRGLRGARLILCQNSATRARLPEGPEAVIHPHTTFLDLEPFTRPRSRVDEIAFVSRLQPWKAGTLAVRALAAVESQSMRLVVYGRGRDQPRMERLAARLGVADRVTFAERLDRSELLARVAASTALLHPSLREEGGFAVAEALLVGTPVVALDRGGPAAMAELWPPGSIDLVAPAGQRTTARRLAAALDRIVASPTPVATELVAPAVQFSEAVQAAYSSATR